VAGQLPRTAIGRHVALQLARSSTGAGANYEEARAAESTADFAHKIAIAAKEMREASYWVRLIVRAALAPGDHRDIAREASELNAMLGASVRTARARAQ
jgi:four helix bundle protein